MVIISRKTPMQMFPVTRLKLNQLKINRFPIGAKRSALRHMQVQQTEAAL